MTGMPDAIPWIVRLAHHARLVVALLGATLAPSAMAQAPAADAGTGTSEIEIIVFRLVDARAVPGELPLTGESVPDGVSTVPADTTAGVTTAYPILGPGSLQLVGSAARLRQSARYRVLYHGGWIQPIGAQARAMPSALPTEATRAGLQGSITLYRERFLHAILDLRLPASAEMGTTWQLRQGRRLSGQEIHYFDHPQFGVILAVRPSATADPS